MVQARPAPVMMSAAPIAPMRQIQSLPKKFEVRFNYQGQSTAFGNPKIAHNTIEQPRILQTFGQPRVQQVSRSASEPKVLVV